MAAKTSAGLLLYRWRGAASEVLLVHPGGPFWARKDEGAWSIPKGELQPGEDPLQAARRELLEETGFSVAGEFQPLAPVRQAGGKLVLAWAIESEVDPAQLRSNCFRMIWPPRSGQEREFPEVDRCQWFSLAVARVKIISGQRPLLEEFSSLSLPR